MNVLIDSDVLIEVLRARNQELLERWWQLAETDASVLYSPVTSAEIWAGARPRDHSAIQTLLESLECAPADDTTGRWAGEFLRQFANSHSLKIADALIAATAVQHRAHLWTQNHRHYPMRGLEFY